MTTTTGTSASVHILEYRGFDAEIEPLRESLCTLGNGYFATRGAAPESGADDVHYPGTYVHGLFNRLKTDIAGQTIQNEDMVNVPNWLPLSFAVEDEPWIELRVASVSEFHQWLDLRRGVLNRSYVIDSENGHQTRFNERRFVHMAHHHIAGLHVTVEPMNWSGRIRVRSSLDGTVTNSGVNRYRDLNGNHLVPVDSGQVGKDVLYLKVQTSQSSVQIAEACRTRIEPVPSVSEAGRSIILDEAMVSQEWWVEVTEGQPVQIEKIVSLYTSRDPAIAEASHAAIEAVTHAVSFDRLLSQHELAWKHIWSRADIKLDSQSTDVEMERIKNLHIFHVLQTASKHTIEIDAGLPPRGLHGEAYRGHILWDELFVMPFLQFRFPGIARSALMYRYRRLPAAKAAATKAGFRGAMYPWQSGSNGEEESQEIHLNPISGNWIPDNSHQQRHVNAAIAVNIWRYYQATYDIDFLSNYGTEMLVEFARLWASMARYNTTSGRYEIHRVMGPDEYHDAYPNSETPGIDNNAYTNVMAVWTLLRAKDALETLSERNRIQLSESLELEETELRFWEELTHKMFIPFHDGVISQFQGYEKLEEFDWSGYRQKYGDIHRLDRILESENDTPNRYKASKQADVLMLFYVLCAEELASIFQRLGYQYDHELIQRNINYYMSRTSHGSTLSNVVHSWVLARSDRSHSWNIFTEALQSDFADIQGGTTGEGIHLGAMAGTLDIMQRCYTGLDTRENALWLNPELPEDVNRISLTLLYRGHDLELDIMHNELTIDVCLCDNAPLILQLPDKEHTLDPGAHETFSI